jgi:hypothetical protein
MAAHDLAIWDQQVTATFPGATGNVVVTAGTPTTYAITLNWTEANGEALSYTMRMQQ